MSSTAVAENAYVSASMACLEIHPSGDPCVKTAGYACVPKGSISAVFSSQIEKRPKILCRSLML